jgi:hypothetical protein
MSHRVMYQTETKAVVKVWGTASADTITLATELLSPTMIVQGTPTVNIIGVTWFVTDGASDSVAVVRNSIPVFNLTKNGQFDLKDISDDTANTSDIVVNITGTGGCYLTLRKTAGYKSKIEPETFGSYDNTTVVGS